MGPEFGPESNTTTRRKMGPIKPDFGIGNSAPTLRQRKRKPWRTPPPRDKVGATYRGDIVVVDNEVFLDKQKICNIKDLKKNLKKLGNSIIKAYLKS